MFTGDPKILLLALLGGIIPSIVWLLFWLREDRDKPEPKGVLTGVFLVGMLSVICILPIQQFIQLNIASYEWQVVLWATVEEIVKYLAVIVVLRKTALIDEHVDWPIYFITAAVGFAALENAMFLIKPLQLEQATVSLLTGHLRFLGSTLLHTVSSGAFGLSVGLAMHSTPFGKKIHFVIGLLLAVILHSVFNFFIMEDTEGNIFKAFGFLWVSAVVLMLIFEKLRRMK
ncbi:MAG: PrsW family intramembrane metalloprotease [Candidatus Pacebacteria bacterium]|nr:PrsW family intramembrane metalloprotease [Candidatus Paceibacterota bacterium]MCF7863002.1 PrsW family intramembrane metalloprotease [Candidatus Paceibacterota bacterium]